MSGPCVHIHTHRHYSLSNQNGFPLFRFAASISVLDKALLHPANQLGMLLRSQMPFLLFEFLRQMDSELVEIKTVQRIIKMRIMLLVQLVQPANSMGNGCSESHTALLRHETPKCSYRKTNTACGSRHQPSRALHHTPFQQTLQPTPKNVAVVFYRQPQPPIEDNATRRQNNLPQCGQWPIPELIRNDSARRICSSREF